MSIHLSLQRGSATNNTVSETESPSFVINFFFTIRPTSAWLYKLDRIATVGIMFVLYLVNWKHKMMNIIHWDISDISTNMSLINKRSKSFYLSILQGSWPEFGHDRLHYFVLFFMEGHHLIIRTLQSSLSWFYAAVFRQLFFYIKSVHLQKTW